MDAKEFIAQFIFEGGILALVLDDPEKSRQSYYPVSALPDIPNNREVFFGPALRKREGNKKADILGTKAFWVDADSLDNPLCVIPPSIVVHSGHGFHLYWLLDEPCTSVETIEKANKSLANDVTTGDISCWNVNRILRVPGTLNLKDATQPVVTKITTWRPDLVYKAKDFEVLEDLPKNIRHKIRTGDSRGHRSRSERDWSILASLVMYGASDELISAIFQLQPCGDKAREHDQYLAHTLEKVRESNTPTTGGRGSAADVEEGDLCYVVRTKRGARRLSTFVLDPLLLLDGSPFEVADALVCDVLADDYRWESKTFSRDAFNSVAKFDKEAKVAAWQWLGTDNDLRHLLPFLLEKLKLKGLPRVAATPTLGLHNIKGKWYFLGDTQVISAAEVFGTFDGPLAWLESGKEHPKLALDPLADAELISVLAAKVVSLNEPEVIWPMLGWYIASCLKPWIETQGYRFPILNVAGTKGSGKTTLIQRVFMPLLGQTDPKSYDAGTTRFVILALLGSSNAVPVAFSEFRYEGAEQFVRFVLLAYDTGHDPRGRGDQTTVDYPLSAPFTVDGEDLFEDPAARERVVVAHLHPDVISEDGPYYKVYKELQGKIPSSFGGYLIQQVLQREDRWAEMLATAREDIFNAFPSRLPDRVRNNHIVSAFGVRLWCDIHDQELPNWKCMARSIGSVFNIESGRARTLADTMVEDLVNAAAQGAHSFHWEYIEEDSSFRFQLASSHAWWLTSRRRQGRGALERDALRAQLGEAPYALEPIVLNSMWMYGVDLQKAQEAGLDVPTQMGAEFRLKI